MNAESTSQTSIIVSITRSITTGLCSVISRERNVDSSMGVNQGEGATRLSKFGVGTLMQIICPPDVALFQNFKICLHYSAVKAYQLHDSNRIFTTSKK